MHRVSLASLVSAAWLALAVIAVGCGAGPTNNGGSPDFNNTNRTNLPGGPINNGGGPNFGNTNRANTPGGPINTGGGPDANTGPATAPAPPPAPDGGAVAL